MTYKLDELPYDYGALAPAISEQIMRLHHQKHHQAYVDKLNEALEGQDHPEDLKQLLSNLDGLPDDIRQTVRDNGGGHLNHSLFWQIMSPDGGGEPAGDLGQLIKERHSSFESFIEAFESAATGLFGSGWVWLMPDGEIVSTPNQDNPIMHGREMPIMGLDVWEHAYYLDYKNVRADYIKAWWSVVNWADVEKRYMSGIIS